MRANMFQLIPLFLCLLNSIESFPQKYTELPNFTKLTSNQIVHLQKSGFGPTVPSTINRQSIERDLSVAATQNQETYDDSYNYPNAIQIKQSRRDQPQLINIQQKSTKNIPQQFQRPNKNKKVEEEEEIEEPDRLSVLLPQTKFNCINKNTGYYADEELGCEVFHYCQDNARHSWVCPDGFIFHQVHLICMPPSNENICDKSSQYHFVNDYLYKPVNLEEHEQKPNISLRYSERYYPENYYDEEEVNQHRNSHRVIQQQNVPVPKHLIAEARTTFRPETNLGQVFRTPNEVNIPLQYRRPSVFNNQRYVSREE